MPRCNLSYFNFGWHLYGHEAIFIIETGERGRGKRNGTHCRWHDGVGGTGLPAFLHENALSCGVAHKLSGETATVKVPGAVHLRNVTILDLLRILIQAGLPTCAGNNVEYIDRSRKCLNYCRQDATKSELWQDIGWILGIIIKARP